jgi:Carboxypeptidase regulatory-like domain/TonB dependent receptor
MKMGRFAVGGMLLLACLSVLLPGASAQYRASIQGTVTDPQGAAVAGAAVTLQNEETGQTYKAESDENGIYNFNGLPPSKFTITVEKAGFKTKVTKGVGVIAEQANSVNVALEVGQTNESVTVNGDAVPLIDTETSNLQGTVNAHQMQNLPSFGRDPFQLLQLAPGAFGDGAQGAGGGTSNLPGTTIGGTGGTEGVFKIENGGQITANGARTGENNYQIDGVGTTSVTWGGTSVITPNEDSIKEIKIVTDNYDAENGRYRGAQVQIISQNGTNNYHGSVYFKIHRPGLNSFTKYNGYNNSNVKDANRFNDWGASAGGPILKNRLFVFFSYETLSNNARQGVGGGWYETSALRALAAAGTNAAAFFNFPGVAPNGGTQTDTLNGQTLDCGNIGLIEGSNCHFIPGQGLDIGSPLTTALGTRDPGYQNTANPGIGGGLDGSADIAFFDGIIRPTDSMHRQYNGRIDFNLTKKDLIAFSMYYVPNSSTGINGNGDRLMNLFNSDYTNRAATVLWDHTFGPTLVNEARVNAAGWINKDLASNPSAPFGLPQVSFTSQNGTVVGSAFLNGYGIGSFNGFDQWTYAAKDVLTKVHGAHTLKMGGEFTHLLSVDAPFWADRPGYTFNNIWDFLNDAPVAESAQFDPQTGVPSALRKDLRSNVIGIFFQDNWKVKSNLTLTAGLRWEYFGPISEKNKKLATVEFGSGANYFTDMHVRTGGDLYEAQKTNFGPQLGFAWSPRSLGATDLENKLVLRGGFGIAFNGIAQSNSLDGRFNPPFVQNSSTLSGCQIIPGDPSTDGCKILYINSFPADVTDPNGYASNPNAILTFASTNLPTTCCTDLTAFPSTWPTTYTYHYTLGAQYDLGNQWVASVGYQGSTTRHLTEHYNLYNVGSVAGLAFNPVVHGVIYYADDGGAHFNALLLQLKHEFGKSFLLDAQYRLSHSVDSGSNAYAGGFYQWNLDTGYATSDYDTLHAFKLYGIWTPTLFRGNHNWAEKIVGGWTISGILNMHSGFPWTPQYSLNDISGGFDPVFYFSQFGGGSSSDSGSGTILPAAYLGGFSPNYRSSATVDATSLFAPPDVSGSVRFDCLFANPDPVLCPSGQQSLGPIPTAPGIKRNSFTGPGYFDVDATLSKAFGLPSMKIIGENAKIEIRANFYNLFNKLNLTGIQNNIFNNHFGEAQNALGSRTIELQARFSF